MRRCWTFALGVPALAAALALGCSHGQGESADAGAASPLDGGEGGAGPGADAGTAPDATADADAGDGGSDLVLALDLHRAESDGGPSPIVATVTATRAGQPLAGLDVAIQAGTTTVAASGDAGSYVAEVEPPFTSGELPLHVLVAGADTGVARTALVLPAVADAWDQPEPIAGLVDTAGTEDSSTVSADGQWLFVATYSPVDMFCCSAGCGGYPTLDGRNPACSDVLGPTGAPARPGLPGADRIVSPTDIDFADPVMCAEQPDGGPVAFPDDGGTYPFALPPVAVYGFHRQPDGSYAEPFLVDTGSDGFVAQPICLTFLQSEDAGDTAHVIFGFDTDSADGGPLRPWFGAVTLGQTTSFGSYACHAASRPGYPTFTPNGVAPLPVGPAGQQAGNTSVAPADGGFYLFSDDESASPPYAEFSLTDGGGSYSDWVKMALPDPTLDRRQPVFAGGRVYYYRAAAVASVAWTGGDPSNAASFSDLRTELAPEAAPTGRVGEVIAVGQPTFAVIGGKAQMFFVYYRRSATGFDGQIGSVSVR